MDLIVDVQGACSSEFIAKEIALLRRNGEGLLHFIIKPPFPWRDLDRDRKRQSIWLYHNFHGLTWSDGHIQYKDMEWMVQDILSGANKIYVKGDAKKKFIQKYFNGSVEDIEGYPSLNDCLMDKSCLMHSAPKNRCSMRNVYMIKEMLDDNDKNCRVEEFMKDVNKGLKEFYGKGSLHSLNVEEIARLPKEFVLQSSERDVHHVWHKLPDEWRRDPDFIQCRRCLVHHPTGGRTQYDGPAPMIKNCETCKAAKKE